MTASFGACPIIPCDLKVLGVLSPCRDAEHAQENKKKPQDSLSVEKNHGILQFSQK